MFLGLRWKAAERLVSEDRAVEDAKRWSRENEGKGIPHEDVLAEARSEPGAVPADR